MHRRQEQILEQCICDRNEQYRKKWITDLGGPEKHGLLCRRRAYKPTYGAYVSVMSEGSLKIARHCMQERRLIELITPRNRATYSLASWRSE